MKNKQQAEKAVSDAIVEKPLRFNVGKQKFAIYPPTLGKMQLLSRCYLELDIDEKALADEPHLEAMRICEAKTATVCRLMSIATFKEQVDLLDDEKIKERADFFKWNTKPQDFSTVLFALLTQVEYANFMSSIRLTKTLRQNASKG